MIQEKEKKEKRFWVRKIYTERLQKGEFHLLVQDLRLHDQEYFFKYFRMSPTTYEELLSFVAPIIVKQRTTMRDPMSPSERLAVTLRFLVTGDAQCTIAASYRISASTINRIISETCAAIWTSLKERNFLHVPSEKQEWKTIAKEFENMWNFPHAIGAIDGKHIVMQAPHNGGSEYFNYKKTHSIVLLAVCNAKYEFTMVDIGDSGRQSDGSVFNNCSLGYAIENNKLNIPDPEYIGNSEKVLPYVLVADDAFGLKRHMMKPYPNQNILLDQKIFNYRLSRARRVIENTFVSSRKDLENEYHNVEANFNNNDNVVEQAADLINVTADFPDPDNIEIKDDLVLKNQRPNASEIEEAVRRGSEKIPSQFPIDVKGDSFPVCILHTSMKNGEYVPRDWLV
nr:uncharacterized protein LOC124816125 [Hydra vulgaris]